MKVTIKLRTIGITAVLATFFTIGTPAVAGCESEAQGNNCTTVTDKDGCNKAYQDRKNIKGSSTLFTADMCEWNEDDGKCEWGGSGRVCDTRNR